MQLTGVGLYSLQDAGRLVGANTRELRRWLFGYTFRHGKDAPVHRSPPLWQTQLSDLGHEIIGFQDLVELRFVKAFVQHGVDLRIVRRCAEAAREMFGARYPFTMKRFRTDGETIYYDAFAAEGKAELLDLNRRQWGFDSIIRPSLYEGLEFREDGSAKRWFPAKSEAIVVDPELAFGKPALTKFGIPTQTIAVHVEAEGSRARVARLFDIPVAAVTAATRFEQRLNA